MIFLIVFVFLGIYLLDKINQKDNPAAEKVLRNPIPEALDLKKILTDNFSSYAEELGASITWQKASEGASNLVAQFSDPVAKETFDRKLALHKTPPRIKTSPSKTNIIRTSRKFEVKSGPVKTVEVVSRLAPSAMTSTVTTATR